MARSGVEYSDQENTRFGRLLRAEKFGVVKAGYFKDCAANGRAFADRVNIPRQFFFSGAEAIDLWKGYGSRFLHVVSYSWLSRDSPDPDQYHLKRLARILKEKRDFNSAVGGTGSADLGVILDFCSLWQGDRSEQQMHDFNEALTTINSPYGHSRVSAIRLTSVPEAELRKYDDRGWTLFECLVIDGKGGEVLESGAVNERNVFTFDDKFDPEKEDSCGYNFMCKYNNMVRRPPLTPERFDEAMAERGRRAEASGVPLFTNGADLPVVRAAYQAAFADLCNAESFTFANKDWGDEELRMLCEVLPHCTRIRQLDLRMNRISDTSKLVEVLRSNRTIERLMLGQNPAIDEDSRKAVEEAWESTDRDRTSVYYGPVAWT